MEPVYRVALAVFVSYSDIVSSTSPSMSLGMTAQCKLPLLCSYVENIVGREWKSMPYESVNSDACDAAMIMLRNLYIYFIPLI